MNSSVKTVKIYFGENLAHKGLFFSTVVCWIIGMLLQKLGLPLVVAKTFDQIISDYNAGALYWSGYTNNLLIFIGIAIVAQVLIDSGLVLLSRLETKVIPKLHAQIYNMLVNQSMYFHNNTFSGSLVNQTNRFVTGYVGITDTFVINITQLFVFVVLSSVVLYFYSPIIALTLFSWSVFFVFINITLTKRRIPLSKARAAADSVLTGYLADSVSNIGAIKTFSAEQQELIQYKKLAEDRANKGYDYWIRSVKNDAVFGLLMVFLQILILAVSILTLKNGAITIGTLILAQVYITQIIAYLWGLSNITKNVEQTLSDAAEMTEIMGLSNEVVDSKSARDLKVNESNIQFKHVSFTHKENEDALFTDLDFSIGPGEKIGLVGPSGGGKTTITKLLLRFIDIQGGEILIDGQNISKVTQKSLRESIAYVPQEPLLFHRSLRENIAYGSPDASNADIEKASQDAHAHDFICDLPKGYDTLVGERGVKLSGGQRQRVAIARAMLINAPILILDEATSALDSESEKLIQDALWKLMEGRTSIVIAHRLSTIQHMDRIIVLADGDIIEQGTHKELIAKNGKYTVLWNHQSGGFLEE